MDTTTTKTKNTLGGTDTPIDWEEYRDWCLSSPLNQYRLLGSNQKVQMQNGKGYETFCMHLAPHKESVPYGGANLCKYAVPACIQGCISKTGHHQMKHARKRRIERTLWFLNDSPTFDIRLKDEIIHAIARVNRKNLLLAARLDGVSDLGLGNYYRHVFPEVMFYDYTKHFDRFSDWMSRSKRGMAPNYHLTFSWSGKNKEECLVALKHGGNVAIPMWPEVPPDGTMELWGYPVIDGTYDDRRFLDPDLHGHVIGLKWKGSRKRRDYALQHGFCIDLTDWWKTVS